MAERFISAECSDCWSRAEPARPSAFELDWIVPNHAESPLEAAALIEADERRQRAGQALPTASEARTHVQPLRPTPGLRLSVEIGPAWHGYLGLRFTLSGRAPKGSRGWLALVELLPAGSEGNATPRVLVRALAGPLNLDAARPGQPLTHRQSMRWPETAEPDRLQPRGWIEAEDGRIVAVAGVGCR